MNREEAIEVLEYARNYEGMDYGAPSIALDMAISALRQQETVTDSHQMTNADRIRSMSDEELALWICGVYDIEEEHGKFINGIIIPGYAPHDIEEWLQQPAEENKHETV